MTATGSSLRRFGVPGVRDEASAFDRVAAVAEQLAVLLAAGVAAPAAWRHLGEGEDAPTPVRAAAAAAAAGDPVGEAIAAAVLDEEAAARVRRRRVPLPTPSALRDRAAGSGRGPSARDATAWRSLAAAWTVAAESGAPLAGSLRDLAEAMRDEAQTHRDATAALAGPRASAKLVTLLPVIAVGFGMLLGFDTASVLLGNPIGIACLVVGLGLLRAGAAWNRALLRRAVPDRVAPGLACDLLAIAMSGGASLERGRAIARDALERHLPGAHDADEVDAVVRLAAGAGAPIGDLLRAEARRRRREARTEGAVRAAALAVRLMLPLGACVLPAFALLGVAPLLISVVLGTLRGAV
ncbi:type II secretion system F family protein [Agromyces sp. MMS24-JH15]|uniref:type II secretion system F family protein n=1 Tax=Agromyces sp. MMS24-JH15 TaxID=3243765 RepID=UPI0037481F8A